LSIEKLIIQNLIHNDGYSRRVVPFLKKEYFTSKTDKTVYGIISSYILKYNSCPTIDAIEVEIQNENLSETEFTECKALVESIKEEPPAKTLDWLTEKTEEFCKNKAIYNAILDSIHIIDGKDRDRDANALPSILSDALAVSFDSHIGHDYLADAEERFQFYHEIEKKIPFDLDFFNSITKGGTPSKTLNIVMAGTGVGKSLFMCHHAANCLSQNLNVLYITCEMAEKRIAERIDANLMDVTLDDLHELPKQIYTQKIETLRGGINGKLIVKEYPTATANSNHFRTLLEELKIKKQFKPDIIFVDYLNICASSRLKNNGNSNSYTLVKSIAEELRGLAVEYDVPIFSATQVNRTGYTSSDIGLEDTSESFGLPATADFMIAMISTEDLDEMGQVLIKQLKNRYNDTAVNRKFVLSINRAKMKLSDVEREDQGTLVNSNQTETEGYGKGFSEDDFERKFEKVSDWKI